MTITSVLWQAADDTDNDGNPDTGANLTNNSPTLNFGQESASNNLTINSALDASMPGGSAAGTFTSTGVTAGSGATDFSAGVAPSTLNWNEVGIIDITANLANYLGSGDTVPGTAANVGRFVPANFTVAVSNNGSFTNTHTGGTTPFTYLGQSFGYTANPTFTITAVNSGGGTTSNYTDAFNYLGLGEITLNYPTTDGTTNGTDSNPLAVTSTEGTHTLTDNADGTISLILGDTAADGFAYSRTFGMVAPFAPDLDIDLAAINETNDGATYGGTATVTPTANLQRFGRAILTDVYGATKSTLAMPFSTEFYNGAADQWRPNTDDIATAITVNGGVNLDCSLVGFTCSIDGSAADLQATGAGITPGGTITLTPTVSITGEVPINLTTPNWLTFDWNNDGDLTDPEDFASASATFGIFRGDDRFYYWREER